jgi:hypothetical protein
VLLTPASWTSPRIAEAFGAREDTVRLRRCDVVRGGVEALKANAAPGRAPMKRRPRVSLRPLLEQPVADRRDLDDPAPASRSRSVGADICSETRRG